MCFFKCQIDRRNVWKRKFVLLSSRKYWFFFFFSLSFFLLSLSSPLLSRCTPPFFVLSVLLYLCCWSFLCSFRPFVSLLLRSFLLLPSQRERTPIVLRNACANGGLDFFLFFLSFFLYFFAGVFYAGFFERVLVALVNNKCVFKWCEKLNNFLLKVF